MFTAFAFTAMFGLLEHMGLGDEATASYSCTDPAFFVLRNEAQITDKTYLQLKGTISTPQQGYSYRFQFVTVDGPQAYAILSLGQTLGNAAAANKSYGRGLPSIQQVQVDQKFNVPATVGLLRIRVEGLTPMPSEFTCDITQPQQ